MSTSRFAVKSLFVPVAAAAVVLVGAGVASAAQPYSGNGYVGVRFDQNETRFLSDVNAGDAVDALIPDQYWGVYLGDGSIYQRGPGTTVYATSDQLIDETAARGGMVSFSVNDPAIWGSTVDIVQEW